MPKATFTLDSVKKSGTDFARVKLGQNEIWRVVVIEKEPTYAWTHRLQKPRFSPVTGEMLMKTVERRNGEKISLPDLDFVGAPTCLGTLEVLDDKGVDPAHCPACDAALKSPEQFTQPERRFAVHVLKYATKSGSPQISQPFSVETRVWVMSENRFAKVTQVITEWGGDPTSVDLVLGPCNNAGFQNYEVAAGAVCEMRADSERLKRAAETFRENNAGDLEPYCGRVTDRRFIEQDIDDVRAAWKKAQGGAAPAPVDTSGTLDSSMLDTLAAPAAQPAAPAGEPLSALDDIVGGTSEPAAAPAEVAAAVPSSPAAPAAPKGEDMSFEDLLNGLAK